MPVELRETRLPGIGVKYGFRTSEGGRLAIVNRDPTPYDAQADLLVHGSAGEVLAACLDSMSSS